MGIRARGKRGRPAGRSTASSRSKASDRNHQLTEASSSDLIGDIADSSDSHSNATSELRATGTSSRSESQGASTTKHQPDIKPDISKLPVDHGDETQRSTGSTDICSNSLGANGRSGENNNVTDKIDETETNDQMNQIIIPSYSAWFNYNSIHPIERRALPEFFNSKNKSKSPEVYMGYRNFIIDTYRLNPYEYLTSTACRRNLPGDVCAILRIHAFLEQWGLINYQAEPYMRPTPSGPPSSYPINHMHHFDTIPGLKMPPNESITTATTLARSNNNVQANIDHHTTSKGQQQATSSNNLLPNLQNAGANRTASEAKSAANRITSEQHNGEIAHRDSDTTEKADKDSTIKGDDDDGDEDDDEDDGDDSKTDRQLQNQNRDRGGRNRDWNEAEDLALLEAIEMFRDDWNKVSEHVGSRTQEECLIRFLRLPIEEDYLNNHQSTSNDQTSPPTSQQPIAFSKTGNPIMSTVAYLASVVDPRVASAAAQAARDELSKLASNNSATDSEDPGPSKDKQKQQSKSAFSENKQNLSIAAACVLGVTAVKARYLACIEERHIRTMGVNLLETQQRKLELKMKHFEELETLIERQYNSIAMQRQQLIKERQDFHSEQLRAAGSSC